MHKNKSVLVALFGVLIIGILCIVYYINDTNNKLQTAIKQVQELQKDNSEQSEEINKLTEELKIYIKENIDLKNLNEELSEKVDLFEEELKEKECPTQSLNGTPIKITMTFYGDFAHENGGYAGIDANGDDLIAGTVASNYYPQGTQFEFSGQVFTVRDRGGSNFNSPNRLDVFVPRLKNESNDNYAKRISDYGRRTVTMYKR